MISVKTSSIEDALIDFEEQSQGFVDFITFDPEQKKLRVSRFGIERYYTPDRVYIETYEIGFEALFSCIEEAERPTKVLSELFYDRKKATAFFAELVRNQQESTDGNRAKDIVHNEGQGTT